MTVTELKLTRRPGGIAALAILDVLCMLLFVVMLPKILKTFPLWLGLVGILSLPLGVVIVYGLWTMKSWVPSLLGATAAVTVCVDFAFDLSYGGRSVSVSLIRAVIGALIALGIWLYVRKEIREAA